MTERLEEEAQGCEKEKMAAERKAKRRKRRDQRKRIKRRAARAPVALESFDETTRYPAGRPEKGSQTNQWSGEKVVAYLNKVIETIAS